MSAEYKNLAAAVVRTAVVDLQTAYNKVRKWEELEKKGKLKEYVANKVDKQRLDDTSLTHDELTTIEFFIEGTEAHQLYFSLLNIEGLPAEIIKQRDYLKNNGTKLEVRIQYYKRMLTREKRDAAI